MAEINAPLTFVDGLEDLLDAARFLAGEAAAADRVLNLPDGRVRHLLPGGEPRLEPGERPAGVHAGGVLGQDGAHDLVEDGHRLPGAGLTLLRAQPAPHFPDDHVIGRLRRPGAMRKRDHGRGRFLLTRSGIGGPGWC